MQRREVGTVARLQIQPTSLKVGQKPNRVYDPSPLLSVQQASVSPAGVMAILPDGQTVLDVHHLHHPDSRHAGSNGVSIGFTPNYARMRERYSDHLTGGCAGENILIETSESITSNDLAQGMLIRCGAGELWLGSVSIARPCLEFSRYALRMPQAGRDRTEIKEALQFLDGGTRGFYVTPSNHDGLLTVSIGDRVYLPPV